MKTLLDSPAYQRACDQIGDALRHYRPYVSEDDEHRESEMLSDAHWRGATDNVPSALKRLDLSALLVPGVLTAVLDITRDEEELHGFYKLFSGLRELVKLAEELRSGE